MSIITPRVPVLDVVPECSSRSSTEWAADVADVFQLSIFGRLPTRPGSTRRCATKSTSRPIEWGTDSPPRTEWWPLARPESRPRPSLEIQIPARYDSRYIPNAVATGEPLWWRRQSLPQNIVSPSGDFHQDLASGTLRAGNVQTLRELSRSSALTVGRSVGRLEDGFIGLNCWRRNVDKFSARRLLLSARKTTAS